MTLPELLVPAKVKAYRRETPPPEGWPSRDTPEALEKSLDIAHQNLRCLRWETRILRWLLIAALSFIGWLVTFLLPYAIHGMAR